jgi:hypothetical protein
MRGSSAEINCDAIQGIVEGDTSIAVARDGVVTAATLKLIEGAVIANIVGKGVQTSGAKIGRDISVREIATCNPLD